MADLAELLVRLDATTEGLRRELKRGDQAVADSARNVEAGSARIGRALQQNNTALAASSRSTGVALQQAGFQVGDFFVQVASGQGVLRPFIQQSSQLLGFFGPFGALAGAAIAVAGALATTFLDLSSSSEKATEAQKAFSDAMRETNDLLEKQEDRAKRTANDQRLKALGDLQTAAAKAAAQIPDLEKKLAAAQKLLEIQRQAGLGDANAGPRQRAQFLQTQNAIDEITGKLQSLRATIQQTGEQSDKLFGNLVDPADIQKLEDQRDALELSLKTLDKDNAATLDAKLAADAAKKGITEETAAIRARIVALQADLDARKQALEFAADEAAQRQKDSEDETENLVKRTQAQGKLAFGANEEIRNNDKLNKALGVSQRAYDEQAETIKQIAAYRAAGLNSDEDVAAAEREAKALVASRYELQGHKDALKEVDDFGERVFDDIGQAATQMSLEGENAFGSLLNVGKAVANELTLEFIKLAAINPLKNALFGKDSPTLASVGGIIGRLFNGTDGGAALAAANASGGGTFGGVGNGPAFRASGGPVTASTPFIVGERGPELFIPHTSGMVVSNDNLGRMGGGPTYYIDARGADAARIAVLERRLMALNASVEVRAISAVSDAARRGAIR